jgi:DNA polymerase-3 subunit beta
MYVTIAQKDLQPALAAVQTLSATGKTQLPILKHLLLVAERPSGLVLRASNEESSIQYRLPSAEVQAAGTALLPAQLFSGLVHDLPLAPVTLAFPSPTDPTAVQVRCQQVKANIKQGGMPIEEFPQVPRLTAECRELLVIDCELLREVIEQVAFAAATDAARPALEGIRIAFVGGRASFGAADAFRLAVRTIAIPDQDLSAEVLIPAQTLRRLARLLPTSGFVRVALSETGHHALLQTTEMDLATRLISGTFPDFRTLVEIQPSTRVVLPTAALAGAVHLMAPFARENRHQLRLRILGERPDAAAALVLEAEAADLGANEIQLNEQVMVQGPDLSLQVNDIYLAEALALVPTPRVTLELSEARRPITLRPVGPLDYVSIIMPLILQATPPASAQETASVPSTAGAR